MKRTTIHPNKTRRQSRALERRQIELAEWESHPNRPTLALDCEANPLARQFNCDPLDRTTIMREMSDAEYTSRVADKILTCEDDIVNLKRKLWMA